MSTNKQNPLITVRGKLVSLGPMYPELIPHLTRWFNDPDTLLLGGDDLIPVSEPRSTAIWTKLLEEDNPRRVFFGIYDNAELQPIGMCNIRDIDMINGTGEIGIIIGEADYRGKGRGTEAVTLVVDYAFTAFRLKNIWLDTVAANAAAIRAYEKAGFKEIGRRRGSHRFGTHVYDTVLMDCIPEEFYAMHETVIANPFEV